MQQVCKVAQAGSRQRLPATWPCPAAECPCPRPGAAQLSAPAQARDRPGPMRGAQQRGPKLSASRLPRVTAGCRPPGRLCSSHTVCHCKGPAALLPPHMAMARGRLGMQATCTCERMACCRGTAPCKHGSQCRQEYTGSAARTLVAGPCSTRPMHCKTAWPWQPKPSWSGAARESSRRETACLGRLLSPLRPA